MHARGMIMREIQGVLLESYAVEVSPEFSSSATEAAMAEVTAWQSRMLEPMYAMVFFDALPVRSRRTRCAPQASTQRRSPLSYEAQRIASAQRAAPAPGG